MPALETVSFHSGYGVPLWMVTHGGRTPLVNAIPPMLEQFSKLNGGAEIGRIVVIDAEGNSVPFPKGLEQAKVPRKWVSRFRPGLMKNKRIFNRTNYQPYRDGDRIRMGEVDLNVPKSAGGGTFRVRVVEIERHTKKEVTHIGASMLLEERDWTSLSNPSHARKGKLRSRPRSVSRTPKPCTTSTSSCVKQSGDKKQYRDNCRNAWTMARVSPHQCSSSQPNRPS